MKGLSQGFQHLFEKQNIYAVNSLLATTSRKRPPPISDHFVNDRFVSQSKCCFKKSLVSDHFSHFLPPISLIRDFSNQNARGNVSTTSVNHTDDIPYVEMFPFIASEFQIRELNLPRRVVYLFVRGFGITDVTRLLRVG